MLLYPSDDGVVLLGNLERRTVSLTVPLVLYLTTVGRLQLNDASHPFPPFHQTFPRDLIVDDVFVHDLEQKRMHGWPAQRLGQGQQSHSGSEQGKIPKCQEGQLHHWLQ